MGFAVWIENDVAYAAGTHEYRPMGVAVTAANGVFRPSDFDRQRRAHGRTSGAFQGLFGSLEDVNLYLHKRTLHAGPAQWRTRALLD